MRYRSLISALVSAALVLGACSSNTPATSPTPNGTLGSSAGTSLPPGATATLPSIGPTPSGVSGTPGATDTPTPGPTDTPGPTATPKPPRPLPTYVRNGKRKDKKIALTFDADMYPFMYADRANYTEYDARVIQLIKDSGIHATIFLNGLYVKAYPDLIKQLAKLPGIELANHSWDHAGFQACNNTTPIQPPLTKTTEITKVADIVKSTTGIDVHWFRPPGGCHSESDLTLIQSLGEWAVGWDCYFGDSLGWNGPQEVANVQNTCQKGSIVVTHLDNTRYHPGIYDALKVLIPWWKNNGWDVVNVGELLGQPTPKP